MYISWDAPRKQSGKSLGSQVWGAPIGCLHLVFTSHHITVFPGFQPWDQVRNPKKIWIIGKIPGYWMMMWLTVLQGYPSNRDSFMQAVWFLQLPGTCLSPVLRLQPSKTRSFPIKTGVIWVPGRYMTGNGCDPKNFKLLRQAVALLEAFLYMGKRFHDQFPSSSLTSSLLWM